MLLGKAASRVGSKIRLVLVVKNGVVAGVSKLAFLFSICFSSHYHSAHEQCAFHGFAEV